MVISTREQILATLAQDMPHLRTQYGVSSLSLFGSVARGEHTSSSDVDVLVEFDRPATLFVLAALRDHLSKLVGRPVDVGTLHGLRPRVRATVEREALRVA